MNFEKMQGGVEMRNIETYVSSSGSVDVRNTALGFERTYRLSDGKALCVGYSGPKDGIRKTVIANMDAIALQKLQEVADGHSHKAA